MFMQYEAVFRDANFPHMRELLQLVYTDVMQFHLKAYKYFRQRSRCILWYCGQNIDQFVQCGNSSSKLLGRHSALGSNLSSRIYVDTRNSSKLKLGSTNLKKSSVSD